MAGVARFGAYFRSLGFGHALHADFLDRWRAKVVDRCDHVDIDFFLGDTFLPEFALEAGFIALVQAGYNICDFPTGNALDCFYNLFLAALEATQRSIDQGHIP